MAPPTTTADNAPARAEAVESDAAAQSPPAWDAAVMLASASARAPLFSELHHILRPLFPYSHR
jgi:hypothetical protein